MTRTAKKPAPQPQPAAPPDDPVTCSKCGAAAYLVVENTLTRTVLVLNGPEAGAASHPCALGRTVAVLTVDPAAGTAAVEPLKDDALAYVRNALRGVLTGSAEWAETATRQLKGYSVVVLTRGQVPPGLPYGGE